MLSSNFHCEGKDEAADMSACGCHGSAATVCRGSAATVYHGSAATVLGDNSVTERTVKQQTAAEMTQRKTDCASSEPVSDHYAVS